MNRDSQEQNRRRAKSGGVDRDLIRALSDPLRVRILSILNERVASPNELANELNKSVQNTAYHVGVLLETGRIEPVRNEPRGGVVEHFYRGLHRALIPPDAWMRLPANIQQNIAADTFLDIADDAEHSLLAGAYSTRPDSHVSHTPLVLDEEGWVGLVELLAETLDRALKLQADSSARAQGTQAQADISATLALAAFESTRPPKRPS